MTSNQRVKSGETRALTCTLAEWKLETGKIGLVKGNIAWRIIVLEN